MKTKSSTRISIAPTTTIRIQRNLRHPRYHGPIQAHHSEPTSTDPMIVQMDPFLDHPLRNPMDRTRNLHLGLLQKCPPNPQVRRNSLCSKSLFRRHCLRLETRRMSLHRRSSAPSLRVSTCWTSLRSLLWCMGMRRKSMGRHLQGTGTPLERYLQQEVITPLTGRPLLLRCPFLRPPPRQEELLRHHSHGKSAVKFRSTTSPSPGWTASVVVGVRESTASWLKTIRYLP